ncbi:protein kinase, partial [Methanothermococcus sp. SCGC AD-155-M21]|nr:protein kinase [Methanothermococcus sp. SCGC AD-155-M21]
IDPKYVYAWNNKGDALYNLGKYNEAIECFNKALEIDPDNDHAKHMKENALNNLRKHEKTIDKEDTEQIATTNNEKEDTEQGATTNNENTSTIPYIGNISIIGIIILSLLIISSIFYTRHKKKDSDKEAEGTLYKNEEASKSELEPKADENTKPELKIELPINILTLNVWKKVEMEIVNKGDAIAKNIIFEFSEDVAIRNLPEIEVKPKSKKIVEFYLKPNVLGEVPLEVKVRCKDHLNREYEFRETIILEVKEKVEETPEKGISPAEFTPKPTTPKTFPPELSERYVEVEFIGKGGFARVFKAKRKDGKEVAVKIPISLDESTGKSFLKEIENWTKLNHKNIVKVYHYNILPIPYFEMELCDHSLEDIGKPMDIEETAWIIFNTAEGLKYAHSQKIIHLDLKPHNILLKDGIPKISDWGLSKVMTESSSATANKGFTPIYASPEQIDSKSKDEKTDIWQLGVVFYELVTGELPFKGDGFVEILTAITTKEPVKPSEINPEAKEVEKIIMKCLKKNKKERYQSVKELQRDLSKYLGIKYKESLKLSVSRGDSRRSAYYCCELLLMSMKDNNIIEAYKYASDLLNYTEGEVKQEVQELCGDLKFRIENGINDIPEELIKKAEVIAHKIRVGF